MTISGQLQDFTLTDIVQTIAAGKRSGKLRLSNLDGEGLILFRRGKIIYVASSSIRETLGSQLIRQSLISQADLDKALEIQHQAKMETRLGTVLVDMGVVSEDTIASVIAEQTAKVFSEFMAWSGGYFSYHPMEFPDCGEVEVDGLDFISEEGIRSDQMLLEIADKMDQLESVVEGPAETRAPDTTEARSIHPDSEEMGERAQSSLGSLKSSIEEIRSPHFTGEISNTIADFAEKLFERWVLFMVARNGFRVTAESLSLRTHLEGRQQSPELLVPAEEPTVLTEVLGRKETIIGPLSATEWNLKILDFVGGSMPEESVAVPLTVNGQILAILYAAHLRPGASPRWREELELLFMQISLTVERDLLRRQAEHLRELRSHRGGAAEQRAAV